MNKWLFLIASLAITTQSFGLAIGTDIVKLADNGQFNVTIESPLSRVSALHLNLATQAGNTFAIDALYKAYTGSMYNSVNLQAGGSINSGDNTQFGFVGAIGYETSPARSFVGFGSVRMTYYPGNSNIEWSPTLGIMFAF